MLLSPDLASYLDGLVPPRHPELVRMEKVAAKTDFPIIGPAAGQLCYLVTRLAGARSVFELGSGFGYSTAWFARAVSENGGGIVHHTVWDEDLSASARRHLRAMDLDRHVRFHVGEAVEALQREPDPFDVIFNDIDKEGYPASLPVMEDRLRPGGVLIVDNLLWSGRVFDPADRSKETEGIREFTRLIMGNPDWITSVIPIRDGVLVAQKRVNQNVAPRTEAVV
jgi:caffeoyl-CoA O-methyltransferase